MRLIASVLFAAATLAAQTNPIVTTSKFFYGQAKNDVLRSAEKVPEDLWSFKAAPDVRSFGQLVAHVADSQYEMCGPVSGKSVDKGIEKNMKGKAQVIAALKEAYSYCDEVYASMTDASAAQTISFFGQKMAKIGVLEFNTQHTNLHYG